MMSSDEVRNKFIEFFKSKGHMVAPSSSLIPNDPSVLFTTAGMQQFKPYYLGEKSPWGEKVVSVQKCVRTSDIDSVGDDSHLTFFEMLGNFAFNNAVSKREAITWSHEFITKEMNLTISHIAVFAGDEQILGDTESEEIWKSIDPGLVIKKTGKEETFWGPTGDEGPCGPTTEIYVNGVEIWNIVFNEYYKSKNGEFKKLENFGIDTGMGLERLLVAVQGKKNVYETDLFNNEQTKDERIVADHVKAALVMISDGIIPSNTGAEYILRRLIRRAVRFSKEPLNTFIEKIKNTYHGVYELDDKNEIQKEEEKFRKTLVQGMKEFEKGTDPFILATTYGFPIELTQELAQEKGITINRKEFDTKIAEHQKLSQTASAGMFKGGLSDANDPTVIKLHTAHHLILAALQQVLGKNIKQRGSNITPERLRMDFVFDRKMTDEEKKNVEQLVNNWIAKNIPVHHIDMPREEAEKIGAEMEFGVKYPEIVSIYFIGDDIDTAISKEFCGGPHVAQTGDIGIIKIQKEEASSAGVRRIKAILEG